jgi:hypothetical protein
MGSSVLKRLAGIVLACLVASGSSSCCGKSAQQIEVPLCPKMKEEMLEHLKTGDDPADVYVADEIIPYCKGIEAMNEG